MHTMKHDAVLRKIQGLKWSYAEYDLGALRAIEARLASTARAGTLIKYGNLVRGIDIRMANVDDGRRFELFQPDWSPLHSAILGDLLGYIACRSFERGGFLASAMAILAEGEPSDGFRKLAVQVGLLSPGNDVDALWAEHVRLSVAWYSKHDSVL